jgi:hypothetical protein
LGPATLDGMVFDGRITATIARQSPNDQGFLGTLVGTISDGRCEGTLNVSLASASAIRSAVFTLSPAAPPEKR